MRTPPTDYVLLATSYRGTLWKRVISGGGGWQLTIRAASRRGGVEWRSRADTVLNGKRINPPYWELDAGGRRFSVTVTVPARYRAELELALKVMGRGKAKTFKPEAELVRCLEQHGIGRPNTTSSTGRAEGAVA